MCPYCAMPLGAPSTQVWLQSGSKKVAYRCVFCAVSEAKTEYKGNLSIQAPTENSKKPLIIKRTGGYYFAVALITATGFLGSKIAM